ncbi:MAG: xanthine dehydrogenase family protein subunit M [Chloroflexia bacterium]|nr:xanthine dehydrogenase family protein subunit M [Chloroflexia bacterium]
MNPAPFTYHKVGSVDEAIGLLGAHGADAKVLAGGHSLLPIMKLRLVEPDHLVDIGGVGELRGIARSDDVLRIGALTTHHQLERDPLVGEHALLLAETAGLVGDRQVRNRGTIGGALAHADAAADYPATILALDATIVARGAAGERRIAAPDFFVDLLTTALEPDELLTAIEVPVLPVGSGGSYQKLANQASGYAVVGVAAVLVLDDAGRCAEARVGVTGAVAAGRRAAETENALRAQELSAAVLHAAAARVADGLDLLDDLHASAEYRRRVLVGLTLRALTSAAERAKARR